MTPQRHIRVQDLGLIDYQTAWELQAQLFRKAIDRKLANRKLSDEKKAPIQHHLLFCEHPPVYTLGKSGKMHNLLLDEEGLQRHGIQFVKTNRGGDITFHGPGQVVGYPILDLHEFFTDIHKYMRYLEEVIIRTLADYGLQGDRLEGATGVWLDPEHPEQARKICALGVRCSRWVTMHGFALNVNTDLSYFDHIIPCGIDDKAVTSLQQELGEPVDREEVKDKLVKHMEAVFEAQLVATTKLT